MSDSLHQPTEATSTHHNPNHDDYSLAAIGVDVVDDLYVSFADVEESTTLLSDHPHSGGSIHLMNDENSNNQDFLASPTIAVTAAATATATTGPTNDAVLPISSSHFYDNITNTNDSGIINDDCHTDCSLLKKQKSASIEAEEDYDYILGTLVVRVVAARNLEVVHKGNGLGNILFGKRKSYVVGDGTANPYVSVRFGNTTQRTSEVLGTTEPVWPRLESTMYMDVTHTSITERTIDGRDIMDTSIDGNKMKSKQQGKNKLTFDATSLQQQQQQASTTVSKSKHHNTVSTVEISTTLPKPILTVAVFHSTEPGGYHKPFHSQHGDSDDTFLGMSSIDLTELITGKQAMFDEWLPLSGSNSSKAAIRIVCEYEASDAVMHPGDIVRFTDYCDPVELYPAVAGRVYILQEVEGDYVLISWTSSEGWVSSFLVHRFMLICVDRHYSVVDVCQDELASLRERIAYSPIINVLQGTVHRVPDEGLITVGSQALQNGLSLLNRWWEGGLETTARDLTFATNWDGRHNPSATSSLATVSLETDITDDATSNQGHRGLELSAPDSAESSDVVGRLTLDAPILPNMPACPITGEPMRDPVVAADGHTYERSAIFRWLSQSDKSPLTGAVLPHKELVPNYMLMSSLQDAALSASVVRSANAENDDCEDDDATTEICIDD